MFTPYRQLFQTPGGLRFSIAGFVGRMPISMDSLALIFIVVHATKSYTIAGALAAVASIVVTIALPFWSRAADRIGQQRTLFISMPFRTFFMIVFIVLVTKEAPRWTWFVSIILAEACIVNAGSLVRRRWLWALGDNRKLINTAYSYEALMDEVVFILGPVIATACATSIAPAAGLVVGLVFMLIGTTFFALQTKTEPPPHPRNVAQPHPPVMRNRAVQAVVLPSIFLGGFFSAVGIVVVGYMQSHHALARTGLMLAIWAAGSATAAATNGVIAWRLNHARRFLIFFFALTVLSIPLIFVTNLFFLGVALFINGLAIAPLIVSAYGVAETAVPPAQITETLAWVIAGMPLGGAIASSVTGWVIDNYGAQKGFIVPFGALCCGLAMSLPYFRTWNRLRSAS
ncbi:MAG TPA: MFS transporter [Candidatus Nanopelagicaceae bacterium]